MKLIYLVCYKIPYIYSLSQKIELKIDVLQAKTNSQKHPYPKVCSFLTIMGKSDLNSILYTIFVSVEIPAKELKPEGFQQMDHCPSSGKCATGVTNWFADLLSSNITHDIFVIYGNQSIKNFQFHVIIDQCKI